MSAEKPELPPARLLVVDDSPTVRLQMSASLQREGFEVKTARDREEALALVRTWRPQCVLLDYFLTDDSGEAVVAEIRAIDARVQIVIITGQADAHPAREMMRRLDIQGFHDKLDGQEKLLVWVEAALRSYARIDALERHAQTLRAIINQAMALHEEQAPERFLGSLLDGLSALARWPGGQGGELDALIAKMADGRCASLVAGAGQYRRYRQPEQLLPGPRSLLEETAKTHRLCRLGGKVCAPMRLQAEQGVLLIDLPPGVELLDEHLQLYLHLGSMALEQARLRSMVTQDALTGLTTRVQLMQRLDEWIRISIRRQLPLSVIFVELDELEPLRASRGPALVDRVLSVIGQTVRDALRCGGGPVDDRPSD